LTKPFETIQSITMDEVLSQLVSKALCFQFHDTFSTHLSPHQFGVAIRGKCEKMVHGIQVTLNAHPKWVML
jgi:hypothetical protein